MELVEDALEGRVDTVERKVEPSEELSNKQLFKNRWTFQRLSLQQEKAFRLCTKTRQWKRRERKLSGLLIPKQSF